MSFILMSHSTQELSFEMIQKNISKNAGGIQLGGKMITVNFQSILQLFQTNYHQYFLLQVCEKLSNIGRFFSPSTFFQEVVSPLKNDVCSMRAKEKFIMTSSMI